MFQARPDREHYLGRLRSFSRLLADSLVKAIRQANDFFIQRQLPFDSFLFATLVRYFTKIILSAQKYVVVEDVEVTIESEWVPNIGLRLVHDGICIKVRKGKKGEVPIPATFTQVAYYNQQMTFDLEGQSDVAATELNVIYVWDAKPTVERVQERSGSVVGAKNGRTRAMLPQELLSLHVFCTETAERNRKLTQDDLHWSAEIPLPKSKPVTKPSEVAALPTRDELPFGLPTEEVASEPGD